MTDRIIPREKTVCFSGHRPEKLPDGGNESSVIIKAIQSMIYKSILECIDNGCQCFMTGCARGIDLWAGQMIIDLKAEKYDIDLVAVLPYSGQGASYKGIEKWAYGNIIEKADRVVTIQGSYTAGCMKERNEYMVRNSGTLIAVVSEFRSGTGQTIRLAEKAGLKTRIINAAKLAEAAKLSNSIH